MGRLFLVNLDGNSCCCKHCMTSLALCDGFVSRSFEFHHEIPDYLFNKVVNVYAGKKENRNLTTGMYTVVEIYCVKCGSFVGWRYEFAAELNQRYKEGKSVLQRHKILSPEDLDALQAYDGDSHTDTDET